MLTAFFWGSVKSAPKHFIITETLEAERKLMQVERLSDLPNSWLGKVCQTRKKAFWGMVFRVLGAVGASGEDVITLKTGEKQTGEKNRLEEVLPLAFFERGRERLE